MNDKKMKLIEAAVKLFGEHDYHTTSVQDIVSLAGVSKGAFYQHFASKEELFHSIFKLYFDKLQNELQELSSNPSTSPKEMIIQAICFQCNLLFQDKDFLQMVIKGCGFEEKLLKEMMFQELLSIIQWYQERIIELYGPSIEPHSLDCAIMLDGSLKTYFLIQITTNSSINSAQLSEYLFERLDDWVYGIFRKQSAPVLDPATIQKFASHRVKESFECAINSIRLSISSEIKDKNLIETMLQSLNAVVGEINKEQCNHVIVQGMYSYLLSLAKQHEHLVPLLENTFSSYLQNNPRIT